MYKWFLFLLPLLFVATSCQEPASLPVLSKEQTPEGETVYKTIPDFKFVDQDSQFVTPGTFAGKAYVADFFFTSCPTICPIMAKNMLQLYEHYENEDQLLFLSHTIDPLRDTVEHLKTYAQNLGVTDQRWRFVTGHKDSLYAIADDYFNIVVEDATLPDGFDHSGRFVLVDQDGYIRAYCNGTNKEAVTAFQKDIENLLHEMENATTDQ
jgi:protein SCO1/2